MLNSVLELKVMRSLPIDPDANVIFDDQALFPEGIEYDNTTGIIKFKKVGQYSIIWWLSTETTLKGAIVFELQSSQGDIIPGCSPIKTGQVSGFCALDIDTADTTLALVNKSRTNVMLSRKTKTKGHLIITPLITSVAPSPVRVYRGNLTTPGSFVEAPLGNGIYYRLEYSTPTSSKLVLKPMNGDVVYDYRRLSSYEGAGMEGDFSDNSTLTGELTKDPIVYNDSKEIHWVLIRVQNPVTDLWSLYEVRFFISGRTTRATIWVNVIEEEIAY